MTYRVAILEFMHETNTFSVMKTGMNEFRSCQYFTGNDIPLNFKGTGTELGGCIATVEKMNWQPVYIAAAHAQPNGPVTEAARAEITSECIRLLQQSGPFDGVFVALHGAMVTETDEDGDCQFLRKIRAVTGNDIPFAVTQDLHANVFDEIIDLANIAISFRTYPHVDLHEVGVEACELLHQAMSQQISPKLAIRRPPILLGCDDGRTTDNGPMCRLLESAEIEMKAPGILNVAINAGFADADVWAAGSSVLVTYDTQQTNNETAVAVADQICDEIWSYREHWEMPMPLDQCIERLRSIQSQSSEAIHSSKNGTFVVADFSDNAGAGAYSDCTAVLSAMLEAGLGDAALGALYDPEAVKTLAASKIGDELTLSIGGKTDPGVGGGPLKVTGFVKAINPDGNFVYEGPMFTGLSASTGPSVCFCVEDIDIMIVSSRMQMLDQNIFRIVGIEPADKSIVVVKSMQHFKGAFAGIASEILITDAGGLCTLNLKSRTYNNLRRPVFPLDQITGRQN